MSRNVFSGFSTYDKNQTTSSLKNESQEWFTSSEAAVYLRISEDYLRNLVSGGRLPYYKFGRRNRYRKSELEQLLLQNRRGGFLWE